MTSDQGSSGGSLQLERTTVIPKTPGLNPNATVFHSHSPSGDQAWEPDEAATPEGQVNGDLGGELVTYPPTPESPVDQDKDDCPVVNGAASDTADETASSSGDSKEESGLRAMLKHQLEYYFSDENLAVDSYLISQMDGDQYVPIVTIANFNQVKKLTSDLEMIVEVLRESSHVQVDEKGEKVRPIHKRCIVILREIPASTPLKEVKDLFSGHNCPLFVSCEFAHGDCWYVTFNSDEDAQRAYQYLREEVKTFLGRPIMARIKAKPIIRGTFVPKNGMKSTTGFEGSTPTYPQQPSRFPQPQFTPLPPMPVQYVNTAGPQSFPFYPPNTVMAWSPTSPPFFDPGMVFAANGYQPQGFKLSNSTGRSGFQSPRNRAQVKQHGRTQSNPERMSEAKPNFETHRHSSVSSSSYQGSNNAMSNADTSQSSQLSSHRHNSLSSSSSYPVHASSHSSTASDNAQVLGPRHMEVTVKDQTTQPPRRRINEFRNRRRKEDGARNMNSNPYTAKEYRLEPEEFELEATSFPPLPGSTNNASVGEVFESKLSDVVKGVAKPSIRDQKPSNSANTNNSGTTTTTPAASNHAATSVQPENKESATMTNGTDSLPTPPASPQKGSTPSSIAVEKSQTQPEVNGVTETKEDNKENSTHQSQSQEPAKLSWAQMAQRAKERAEREAAEVKKQVTVDAETDNADQVKPGTQKDSAQTSKAGGPSKGLAHSDSEPRDLRPQSGRRVKDNREWKDRDRDKERDRRKDQEPAKLSAK